MMTEILAKAVELGMKMNEMNSSFNPDKRADISASPKQSSVAFNPDKKAELSSTKKNDFRLQSFDPDKRAEPNGFARYGSKEINDVVSKDPESMSDLNKLHDEMKVQPDAEGRNKGLQESVNSKLDENNGRLWYALEKLRELFYKIDDYSVENTQFSDSEKASAIRIPVNDSHAVKNPGLFKDRFFRGEDGKLYVVKSPCFRHLVSVQLPEELLKKPEGMTSKSFENKQFEYCTEMLRKNPNLLDQLSSFDRLYVEKTGCMPYDTVWHHDIKHGRMLLVSKQDHDTIMGGAAHTGGDSLWKEHFASGKYSNSERASFSENIEKSKDELAGVERGRDMTFTEADSGNVNPNYEECNGFQCNCQTCVVVFEARLRGYDVEAMPYRQNSNADKLAEHTNLAWLTPEGKHPSYVFDVNANSPNAVYNFISQTVKPGERYTMEGNWKGCYGSGHIISVFREDSGNLVFYDPQTNNCYNERSIKENFLNRMQKGNTENTAVKLLRIDNLAFDKPFVSDIVRRAYA